MIELNISRELTVFVIAAEYFRKEEKLDRLTQRKKKEVFYGKKIMELGRKTNWQ